MIDKDDYEAWRDSAMTKWFMGCVREIAEQRQSDLKEILFNRLLSPAGEWASQQPRHAGEAKFVDALLWVANDLTLKDLQDEEVKTE